jgi:hypothetical protein
VEWLTSRPGLEVGSTRPLSRAERRAAAARVRAEEQVRPAEEVAAPVVEPPTSEETAPDATAPRNKARNKPATAPAMALSGARGGKSDHLRPSCALGRLPGWNRHRGLSLVRLMCHTAAAARAQRLERRRPAG